MNLQDPKQILRDRAEALAQTVDSAPVTSLLEVLEFRLAKESYAIESRFVREVHPLRELTPLPCTPPFIRGIVNVRGRILPVMDFKKFFNLPEKGLTDLHRIVFVSGHGLDVGLLCDAIEGVKCLPIDTLQPSLSTLEGVQADYLKGITADRLVVLDLDRILADPRIVVHEEVES